MNSKPGQQVLTFEGNTVEGSKSSPFQSFRGDKPRMSYGGGFHMNKKTTPSPISHVPEVSHPEDFAQRLTSPNGYSSIDVLENEIKRLKDQSQSFEQLRKNRFAEGILHLDPPSHRHQIEEDYKPKDFKRNINLEELELLKEQNAARILEIEAEMSRNKKDQNFVRKTGAEYIPVFIKTNGDSKKPKKITDYQKKYQEKFENYLRDKENKRINSLIKGKEVKVSDSARGAEQAYEETAERQVLLKWLFKKLDKDRSGTIDKVELIREFQENPEAARLFGFTEHVNSPRYIDTFNKIFESIGVGAKHEILMDEFLLFFERFSKASSFPSEATKKPAQQASAKKPAKQASPKKPLGHSISAKSLRSEEQNMPICLLPHKHMAKLEEIFNALDVHEDLIVRRGELIDAMLQDTGVIKILHIDALRVSAYQILDLESMLAYIRSDGDGEEEHITWNQFLDYFFVQPVFEEGNFEGIENPKFDEIDLPPKYMAFIHEIFEELDKKAPNKVSTFEFIKAVRFDSRTQGILSFTARIPGGLSAIPEETVQEVLARMEETAESLVSWVEVIGFFSKRGVPKDSHIGQALVTKGSFVKAKMPNKPVKEYAVQTDDVELKKNSSRSRSISPRPRVTFHENTYENAVTVPAPFKFEEREKSKPKSIREKWIEKTVKEKEDEEMKHVNFKYVAQDVPAEVMKPKYESLKKALQDRSVEVKRQSAERTKQLEKPFNFYLREKEKVKKAPTPPPEFTFKAKPIPWACTVPLYDSKLREEEAIREERKSRAAQQDLRKASLPPRMEMYQHIKQNKVVEERTPSPTIKVKEPPNFEKLHERFAKTLEAKKKAKQTTRVEPFLIDTRVEEANKKKEEKRKIKEEKQRKEREEEEEKRKMARLGAKDSWKAEHDSLKKNPSSSRRTLSKEEKKFSPPRRGKSSGKEFTLDDMRAGDKFTKKDLEQKSVSSASLKSPANDRQSRLAANKAGDIKNPLAADKKTTSQSKPNLKKNELAPPEAGMHDLAPASSKGASAFTKSDLAPGGKGASAFTKSDLAPSGSKASPGFTTSDLSLPSSSDLAPPGKKPWAPPEAKKFDLAPPEAKKNDLAPPSSSDLAPPGKKSSWAPPEPKKNDLAPPGPSNADLPPSRFANPLAPKMASIPEESKEKPQEKKKAWDRSKETEKKESKTRTASKSPDKKQTKGNLTKTEKEEKKKVFEGSIKPKLKSIISAEEQQAAAEKSKINENLEKRKEELKKKEQEYKKTQQEMVANVSRRPLLVESATDSTNKNKSKMKILMQIKKSLESSGIKHESYFSQEELDLLQEAEYLTKMNRLK